MPISAILPRHSIRNSTFTRALTAFLLLLAAALCHAASVHGVVTDATGAKVTGASVVLIGNGKVVASAVSHADGSFEITT
ncbi:MAG TPA: hypothetical protein VGS10_13335, partial [Terracidiphilus sp.]|nr:hypothetical protein [Terracidiphilus sp.]